MQYLCLICAEKVMEHMSDADAREHYREYRDYVESIRDSGHYVGGNRLKPADTATTVRVRHGKMTVTDGPFAETTEQLGGYILINAENLDEALEIAARIPGAKRGCVEIRPVADDAQTRALAL
jgi:hypothetical protein